MRARLHGPNNLFILHQIIILTSIWPMVKLSDLLVDKSVHGLDTDRHDVIRSPV